MSDTAALLQSLKAWSEQGWIRRLDHAFAGFMVDLCPDTPAPVVMAAALVAHMEGRGHACLPIDDLLCAADELLGWPSPASAQLNEVMAGLPGGVEDWLVALRSSPLVGVEGEPSDRPAADATSPLVWRRRCASVVPPSMS